MPLQLTDIFIGSITPSHPYLVKSPFLFLQVAVNGKPLARIRALTVDANSGIWELESNLDIPPNAQMLSFDIVRYDEKKLVSATLEVSTLLKRVKANSKECCELSTCESCSSIQIIVSFFVKQPKRLAIKRSPHQVSRSSVRNEDDIHQAATIPISNIATPTAQDESSLPTREELRSRYANIINLPNTEQKAKQLNAIGAIYHQHYKTSGTKTDLDEAIRVLEQLVEISSFYSELGQCSYRLASALNDRFQHSGTNTDKERAIEHCQDAILLSRGGDSKNPGALDLLGQCLELRYQLLGDEDNLGRALRLYTKAMELTPEDTRRLERLNHLGIVFIRRFERLGGLEDAESAISVLQKAVDLTPDGHADKPSRLNNLGIALLTRFKWLGGLEDVETAIYVLQNAVDLTPDGHADKPPHLNNLGIALLTRFKRLGGLEDVESATSVLQNAVHLTRDDHADKPSRLNNLGNALLRRFERLGGLEDAESGISVLQKAVELSPDTHPDKPSLLTNLGNALGRRFERLERLEDAESGISVLQKAVELTPDGHADQPTRLNNLGNAFRARFCCSSDINDLDKALSSFRTAANSLVGPPSHLFRAARSWAQCEAISSTSPLPAFSRAIQLLPQIAWLGLSVLDQHALLTQVGDVVRDAVNAAIEHDNYETAVEWAEQGRSIVWQNLLNLRTPVDQLAQSHPDLAHRLRTISRQLETSLTHETTSDRADKSGLEEVARRHRELSIERDKLIDQIRQIPEFKSFMSPKKFNELCSVAREGPVVILNVHKSRSDALVLIPGDTDVSVVVIPLEGFSYKTCENMQKKMNELLLVAQVRSRNIRKHGWGGDHGNDSMFKRILGILWKQVVRPVIDALAYRVNLDDPPRIWWCPTGPLAFLPIHAAGEYDEIEVGHKVSDYVISSYCPTLSALLESPQSPVESAWKMVTVAQPFTPCQSPIPKTAEEVKIITRVGAGLSIDSLIGASATVNSVKDAMKNTHWIHLACHGQQCVGNAMDSGLLLHDGKLKLSDLVKESLPNAEFAFLSACQTATGDDTIAEESAHLAAGMLLAGYRSVIATMWSIQDNDAPRVAEDVYVRMFKEGKPNRMEGARALHEAVKRLRESGAGFLSWVPFIHVGR